MGSEESNRLNWEFYLNELEEWTKCNVDLPSIHSLDRREYMLASWTSWVTYAHKNGKLTRKEESDIYNRAPYLFNPYISARYIAYAIAKMLDFNLGKNEGTKLVTDELSNHASNLLKCAYVETYEDIYKAIELLYHIEFNRGYEIKCKSYPLLVKHEDIVVRCLRQHFIDASVMNNKNIWKNLLVLAGYTDIDDFAAFMLGRLTQHKYIKWKANETSRSPVLSISDLALQTLFDVDINRKDINNRMIYSVNALSDASLLVECYKFLCCKENQISDLMGMDYTQLKEIDYVTLDTIDQLTRAKAFGGRSITGCISYQDISSTNFFGHVDGKYAPDCNIRDFEFFSDKKYDEAFSKLNIVTLKDFIDAVNSTVNAGEVFSSYIDNVDEVVEWLNNRCFTNIWGFSRDCDGGAAFKKKSMVKLKGTKEYNDFMRDIEIDTSSKLYKEAKERLRKTLIKAQENMDALGILGENKYFVTITFTNSRHK